MTPREQLQGLLEATQADQVTVPRSWLRAVLEEPMETPADLTVRQVAKRFGRGASTVRSWCETGQLPGAYRLRGREWRIPEAALRQLRMQEQEKREGKSAPLSAWREVRRTG